jgi:hypothetical protein
MANMVGLYQTANQGLERMRGDKLLESSDASKPHTAQPRVGLHDNPLCTQESEPTEMNQITLIVMRHMPLFFSIAVVLTTILALLPSTSVPQVFQFWDKAQHSLAFTVLTITGGLAFPKKLKLVYIGLIMHGALLEIMQNSVTTTRFGDVLDLLADGVGVLIGIVAYASLTNIRAQRIKTRQIQRTR